MTPRTSVTRTRCWILAACVALNAQSAPGKLLWKGHGWPPAKLINGLLVEGAHVPLSVDFQFDQSKQPCVIKSSHPDLDPDVRKWYFDKIEKEIKWKKVGREGFFSLQTNESGDIFLYRRSSPPTQL